MTASLDLKARYKSKLKQKVVFIVLPTTEYTMLVSNLTFRILNKLNACNFEIASKSAFI